MPLQHASAEFLAWAEHEGVDLTMLYERLRLTPTSDGALSGFIGDCFTLLLGE
jgi:hypothetical protein